MGRKETITGTFVHGPSMPRYRQKSQGFASDLGMTPEVIEFLRPVKPEEVIKKYAAIRKAKAEAKREAQEQEKKE